MACLKELCKTRLSNGKINKIMQEIIENSLIYTVILDNTGDYNIDKLL